MQDSVETGI